MYRSARFGGSEGFLERWCICVVDDDGADVGVGDDGF